MNVDLLLGYEAINRLSDAWHPERSRTATFEPRSRRTRRTLFQILRAAATRVSRKTPAR